MTLPRLESTSLLIDLNLKHFPLGETADHMTEFFCYTFYRTLNANNFAHNRRLVHKIDQPYTTSSASLNHNHDNVHTRDHICVENSQF